MKFVFVSNYLNHHQIPFCNAMYELLGGDFAFVQTEPMEEERVRMGWSKDIQVPYLRLYYHEQEACRRLIADGKVVFFGGTDEEGYIRERLDLGSFGFSYCEGLSEKAALLGIFSGNQGVCCGSADGGKKAGQHSMDGKIP